MIHLWLFFCPFVYTCSQKHTSNFAGKTIQSFADFNGWSYSEFTESDMVQVFLTFEVALNSPLQGFVAQFSTPGCEWLDEPRL